MSTVFNNYSSITIDDIYHPTLVQIYSIYWDVSVCITTGLFVFMMYTIVKKSSTEMKGYRIYLIHQLTWSFLFDMYLGGWKPVPLWPFYLGYSVGWYSSIPKDLSLLPLVGVTFFSVGMGFSIYISAMHRYMQASPFSKLYDLYTPLINRLFLYTSIFLFLECGLCIPLWMYGPNYDDLRRIIISQAEYMEFFFNEYPSIFGFSPELNGGNTILFMGILIGVLVAVLISVVFLYLNFLRILNKNKKLLSQSTYRMQVSLYVCYEMSYSKTSQK